MMDRNREARRAAAMALSNGLPRRRHRTSTPGSLRDSPEDEGGMEMNETGRLRDRTVKKERDREMMREREVHPNNNNHRDSSSREHRDRLNRTKRRRGDRDNRDHPHTHNNNNSHHHHNHHSGLGDDTSEESVNDDEDDDDDTTTTTTTTSNNNNNNINNNNINTHVRYAAPPLPPSSTNPTPPLPSTSAAANSLTSHRKSYPPPTKMFRSPTWKAPDEMIGVSVPRKARSASTKRSHEWSGSAVIGGGGGEQLLRQASSSPVRLAAGGGGGGGGITTVPSSSPSQGPPTSPLPSSSNMKLKKIRASGGPKLKPPKAASSMTAPTTNTSTTTPKSSSPSIQEEIEIEVAEVLYGLMRQSHAPAKPSSAEVPASDSAKSRVSSPISAPHTNSLTIVAPKRKRPRPYPEEAAGPEAKASSHDRDQAAAKMEEKSLENGDLVNSSDQQEKKSKVLVENGVVSRPRPRPEEEGGRAKVEEASPKLESNDHDRIESTTSSSIKPNVKHHHREDNSINKFKFDLMASPEGSPEGEGEREREGEGEDMIMGDDKSMVTDREAETVKVGKGNEEDEKVRGVEFNAPSAVSVSVSSAVAAGGEANINNNINIIINNKAKGGADVEAQKLNLNSTKEQQQRNNNNIDLHQQLDVEKQPCPSSSVNDHKLSSQLSKQQPLKLSKDEAPMDCKPIGGQTSSMPTMPMSVPPGWPGGLAPMGYVAPLQGVVSMDGTAMAPAPIQAPPFIFSQPKPKRCATHCHIAKSVSLHQEAVKMNPYWSAAAMAAAAAGSSPLFGGKPYNLNMVPSSADLHAAASRGFVNSAQDKSQAFAFFPGQPAPSKDKQANSADGTQKKQQFLLPQSLPPGAVPGNLLPPPAIFFPQLGQHQAAAAAAAAAAASARPSSGKSPSSAGNTASTSSSAPMSGSSAAAPAMSFSYPNMGGNETQFMAILGNGAYPFPMTAHVGGAPPFRGSHPQAMSFFNGSFYSSQMLHPSQLPQPQSGASAAASQAMQMQQQNLQNPSISTASSSSQKHLQNQQQRPQGTITNGVPSNPSMQNFQSGKGRPTTEMGGEDSPSTADSRTRPNMSVYNQNFAMPFHSNFAFMTPPSSMGGSSGSSNGDKKQQQQAMKGGMESLAPTFPMSFASMNGATAPGLDISSMAQNHSIFQNLPEAARHNYQIMAAAAQAAQAAQQKKNNYRNGSEDGKAGASETTNFHEDRKAMASRASAPSMGQSIAFSRDLAETNVVDSSARSLNLVPGSGRSSGPTPNPSNSQSQQQQQQQLQQQQSMLFSKQQQFVAATVAAARNKSPSTSNGGLYPDHINSASVMAAKFPNAGFPPLTVQSSGTQSPQWKNSVRPNTSQVPSQSVATSTASTIKNLSQQQQGRPQQNHTQISFGVATPSNSKPSSASQGQQSQNNHQTPSPPMMVGSPTTSSISKGTGGSPRTATSASTSNKAGNQASTMSVQQGRNSPTPSLTSQKPSILGSPHVMSSSGSAGKPQDSQQQPQLSKQAIQQTQLFFSNPYMQNTSSGSGYYLQRHRPDNPSQMQQGGSKVQGSVPTTTSSSGMLSLCSPVSLANASTSDPAKAVAAAAAAAASNMKGGISSQGLFHGQFAAAAQSAGGTHQLLPAGFSYVNVVPSAVQVKPTEQKQPAGE